MYLPFRGISVRRNKTYIRLSRQMMHAGPMHNCIKGYFESKVGKPLAVVGGRLDVVASHRLAGIRACSSTGPDIMIQK